MWVWGGGLRNISLREANKGPNRRVLEGELKSRYLTINPPPPMGDNKIIKIINLIKRINKN